MSDVFDHEWLGETPEGLAEEFDDIDDALERKAAEAMRDVVLRIEGAAKERANVESGNMRSQIRGTILPVLGDVIIGVVGVPVDYAKWVHEGTGPHTITAENGVLAFEAGGEMVFAREVQHPGYEGNPFLDEAIRANIDYVNERFARAAVEAIEEGSR